LRLTSSNLQLGRAIDRSTPSRLATLRAGIPGAAFLTVAKAPALVVLAAIFVFLETASALRWHRAIGHRQSWGQYCEDSRVLERAHGATTIGAGSNGDGRVVLGLIHRRKKRGGRSRPHSPAEHPYCFFLTLPPLRCARNDGAKRHGHSWPGCAGSPLNSRETRHVASPAPVPVQDPVR
jgi:hypothetical protein